MGIRIQDSITLRQLSPSPFESLENSNEQYYTYWSCLQQQHLQCLLDFFSMQQLYFFFSSVNQPMSCPKGQLSCPFRISYASIFFKKVLKVSYSRKKILVSSIFSKNELENVNFCPSLLGQKFFVRFLGEKVLSKLTDLQIQCQDI